MLKSPEGPQPSLVGQGQFMGLGNNFRLDQAGQVPPIAAVVAFECEAGLRRGSSDHLFVSPRYSTGSQEEHILDPAGHGLRGEAGAQPARAGAGTAGSGGLVRNCCRLDSEQGSWARGTGFWWDKCSRGKVLIPGPRAAEGPVYFLLLGDVSHLLTTPLPQFLAIVSHS